MDDRFWATRFEQELNALMEKDPESVKRDDHGQLEPALQAAKRCLATNFVPESRVRTKLLARLLAKISRPVGSPGTAGGYGEDTELDELDLSEVVGGVAGPSNDGCALCKCTRSSSSINTEHCPECGHARSLHR